MAEFADRMKSFTDHLRASKKARNESLAQVHASTEDLRDRAREFMGQVAEMHRERAEALHDSLAAHHEERARQMGALRHRNQESQRQRRDDLNELLSQARASREEAVGALREGFQHARDELAHDLHEAAFTWQAFASEAHHAPTKPAPRHHEPRPTGKAHTQHHHHNGKSTANGAGTKTFAPRRPAAQVHAKPAAKPTVKSGKTGPKARKTR